MRSVALVFGLLSQHLLLGRSPGLAFPLVVGLLLFVLDRLARAEKRVPTTMDWGIGATAILFAIMLAIRAAPWITALNMLAMLGLLVLHATLYRAERLSQLDGWRIGFELVAVASLALGLLWLLNLITRRSAPWHAHAFGLACSLIVALVLGMLGSAAYRMWLYEQAYGYTLLRLLTFSWMVWLASILLLFLAAVLRDRPRWFSLGLPTAALCCLLALNLMNPEAMIVRENMARYHQTGKLDGGYLTQLSPDAAMALMDARISLMINGPEDNYEFVQQHLRAQHDRLISQAEREG